LNWFPTWEGEAPAELRARQIQNWEGEAPAELETRQIQNWEGEAPAELETRQDAAHLALRPRGNRC